MVQEIDSAHSLWVHQESAVIGAESHDIWSFTPEFLLSNEIVPKDWKCTLATRGANDVTIQYGPLRWWMTENNLWITSYPECPIEDETRFEDGQLVSVIARKYLASVPFMPVQRMWLFWRLSMNDPIASEGMLNRFLGKGWPEEFEHSTLQPNLSFAVDNTLFQMSIKNEQIQLEDDTFEDSIVFECYTSNFRDQGIENLSTATVKMSARLNVLQEAINHLRHQDNS